MAVNAMRTGYTLSAFDVNKSQMERLREAAAEHGGAVSTHDSVASAVDGSDLVLTMLPSSSSVESVYCDADGVLSAARRGALLIDSSTIDPATTRRVHASAESCQMRMIDAPVSGGVGGAEAGTLTFMVGGSAGDVAEARPVLEMMGKNIAQCGAIGSGQITKICNNLVLGISMAGVAEAMNLGVRLGVDPATLAGVINTSSGRCWSSDTYNPVPGVMPGVPSSRNYDGGFGVDLMAKDLSLSVAAAHESRTPLPLGGLALQLYNLLSAQGYSRKDFSSIYDYLSKNK
jgi:3-hydroxyisobutyrate dehydrogenase